ncbi:MAG: hypothetical protein KBI32_15480, partial [Phycisphaerae bacterium]|nr:hypothetical protein [Phycisphaerae bacterium]
MKVRSCNLLVLMMIGLSSAAPLRAESGLVAHWSFEKSGPEIAQDAVSGIIDAIEGTYTQPHGIVGSALKLDGYTTCII